MKETDCCLLSCIYYFVCNEAVEDLVVVTVAVEGLVALEMEAEVLEAEVLEAEEGKLIFSKMIIPKSSSLIII